MIDNSDSLVFMIKIFFLWKHEHEAKVFWNYCYSDPVPFMQLVYYKSERVLQTWSCYESWKKKRSLSLILFSFKFWMTEKNSMSLNGESIKCNIYAKLAEHKANQTCSSWLTTSWQEQVYNKSLSVDYKSAFYMFGFLTWKRQTLDRIYNKILDRDWCSAHLFVT